MLAGLSRVFWVHSMNSIPWLTFLRFFALLAGVSESGAEERLSFAGERLLGALAAVAFLPGVALLVEVMIPEELPLVFCAPSVIK